MSSSVCKVCHHSGHTYRNCTHPCIAEFHQHAINVWLAAKTDPRDRTATSETHTRQRFEYDRLHRNIRYFIDNTDVDILRAILYKYKKTTKTFDYTSIREWRNRSESFHDDNRRIVNITPNLLPSRVGVYSQAARYDINEMMNINYTEYAIEYMESHPQINDRNVTIANSTALSNMLQRASRHLSNPNNIFTPDGLVQYSNQLVTWIEHLSQITEASIHIDDDPSTSLPSLRPRLTNNLLTHYPDEYDSYRNRSRILHMINTSTPSLPVIDVSQLNTPPPPMHRNPIFNIDIIQKEPSWIIPLPHKSCSICWDEINEHTCCTTDCNHTYCLDCMNAAIGTVRSKTRTNGRFSRYMTLQCAMCRGDVQDLVYYSDDNNTTNKILEMRMKLYTPIYNN